MAIKDLLQISFIKDAVIQLAVTTPWILFFVFLNQSDEMSACAPKTISRLEFAYKYHILSTILILVITGVKYHAHSFKIDISKQFSTSKGVKILQIIQSAIAWIALIGLYMSLKFECPSSIQNAIIFYIVAQVIIIVTPFIRLLYSVLTIKKKNKKEEKEDLLKKEQRENTLKKGKAQ